MHGPNDASENGADSGAGYVVRARDAHGSVNLVRLGPAGQLGHPALPVPRQLPRDVRGLVGRDAEVRWLDRTAKQGTVSVISGAAGVGKSSLAVHWAHRVRIQFPDGQLYADLRGRSVLDGFLRALGIPDSRVPSDVQEKEGLYRSLLADRKVLIVLDNPATADQVRPLLPGSSGCAVIVTSRDRLSGLEDAEHLALEPLRHEDAIELLRDTLQDRADDDAELGDLAVACARMPLALRIAAQRVARRPVTPIAKLLAELHSAHSFLAWSYDALPPTTARFFRLLTLHPGPDMRLEAAAALAGVSAEKALSEMRLLTDAQLVELSCGQRFRLHDVVAAYARDRAEAQEAAEALADARRRVLEWYVQASYEASQRLDISCHFPFEIALSGVPAEVPEIPDLRAATLWYESEWVNLVAAVDLASDCGYAELVWQLAATMRFVFLRVDRRDAGLAVQRRALGAARHLGDLRAEATIFDGLWMVYYQMGDRERNREANDAAIAIWQRLGDRRREAASHTNRWFESIRRRNWKCAVPLMKQIIATVEELGERRLLAINLGNLGECMLELGELASAEGMVSDALDIHREFGWPLGIADTLWNLARIMRARGKMPDALPYAREAVEQARLTADANLQGRTMLELAVVLQANRKYDESMIAYQKALDHARLAGDRGGEARVLERVAVLHHERGNLRAARGSHELSIDISREICDRWFLGLSLERFAETMDRLGRYRDARAARAEALELFKEFDEPAARAAGDRLSAALGMG